MNDVEQFLAYLDVFLYLLKAIFFASLDHCLCVVDLVNDNEIAKFVPYRRYPRDSPVLD